MSKEKYNDIISTNSSILIDRFELQVYNKLLRKFMKRRGKTYGINGNV